GFIFIICATGLSAQTMLEALQARLPNTTQQEITNAAAEQIKITLLRINKALD
ncbi:OHCU decarboxylase, partial [Alteromonadaceae bacterium A_SAG8]|nr:OHCU decarboxylase [Alteromonadaceae bacterium A_SAG8]